MEVNSALKCQLKWSHFVSLGLSLHFGNVACTVVREKDKYEKKKNLIIFRLEDRKHGEKKKEKTTNDWIAGKKYLWNENSSAS